MKHRALIDAARQKIVANNLAYHNINHVEHMQKCASFLCDGSVVPELEVAIWYHDAIYDPTSDDNERNSVYFFLDNAKLLNYKIGRRRKFRLKLVTRLIGWTRTHLSVHDMKAFKQYVDRSELILVMLDADLSGLADDYDAYLQHSANIRTENLHLSDSAYYNKRIEFLNALLAKPTIFYTLKGYEAFERKARDNISSQLPRPEGRSF